jgi:hypothetical protein
VGLVTKVKPTNVCGDALNSPSDTFCALAEIASSMDILRKQYDEQYAPVFVIVVVPGELAQ